MEFEVQEDGPLKASTFSSEKTRPRAKSSLRLQYEAEKEVLRAQLGSLEQIREQLGLSQRKMAQLLMVDPSAWTRWIQNEERVPPHVYRSLQWYLRLIEDQPQWHPQQSFRPHLEAQQPHIQKEWDHMQINWEKSLEKFRSQRFELEAVIRDSETSWSREKQRLEAKIEKKDMSLATWKMIVIVNSLVLFFSAIWSIL